MRSGCLPDPLVNLSSSFCLKADKVSSWAS